MNNVAILFSEMDCFELACKNCIIIKVQRRQKAGQEAPEDIEIPAGPTELLARTSNQRTWCRSVFWFKLIKVKFPIKQAKVVARKAKKFQALLQIFYSKLDIKPFTISLIPLAGSRRWWKKSLLGYSDNREAQLKN